MSGRAVSGPSTVWLLTTTDPDRMLDEPYDGPGVELSDGRIVTLHSDFDALLRHMRRTYDPTGYYAVEGSGSFQNYKHLEGYAFGYQEVTP